MTINYIEPLKLAWVRMKKALFQPFDIVKWLAVGFTAFLAELLSGRFDGYFKFPSNYMGGVDPGKIPDIHQAAIQWLQLNTLCLVACLIGFFILVVVIAILTWVRSRGEFMFLDNVVRDQAEIAEPWRRFETLGNSLFLWRLCFGLIWLAMVIVMVFACIGIFVGFYNRSLSLPGLFLPILGISLVIIMLLVMMVIAGYISAFLQNFIIPIMYKYNISVLKAWIRFLPLLKRHLIDFLIYGLFIFAVYYIIKYGLLLICCACCLIYLILFLPYIGAVILLPVTYTLRCFSIEFLAQFGPEFTLFPDNEPISPIVIPSPPADTNGGAAG